jgi:xanthine dehydrogenase accessory factor
VTIYESLRDALRNAEPIALATIVEGPNTGAKLLVRPGGIGTEGSLGDAELDRVVGRDALAELEAGRSLNRHYGPNGQTLSQDEPGIEPVTVFIESFAPPPTMVIFGAVDFTAALAKVAKVLGYRVVVCDARPIFATERRFPMADEVVVDWPDRLLTRIGPGLGRRDAVCVLTHDPKFDVPAIVGALATNVGYIGVMGSRKTHERRMLRLAEVGVTSAADLDRVMSPIGLDLGARTPEETAISICAEIISRRTGREAPSLRTGIGAIH